MSKQQTGDTHARTVYLQKIWSLPFALGRYVVGKIWKDTDFNWKMTQDNISIGIIFKISNLQERERERDGGRREGRREREKQRDLASHWGFLHECLADHSTFIFIKLNCLNPSSWCHCLCCHTHQNLEGLLDFSFNSLLISTFLPKWLLILLFKYLWNHLCFIPTNLSQIKPVSLFVYKLLIISCLSLYISSSHASATLLPVLSWQRKPNSHLCS